MEGKDPIKDLFSEKLSQLEVPVRPEIWSAVSSQIGAAAPAAAGGLSIVSKIIIGISVAASVSVGVYLATKDKEKVKDQNKTAQQSAEAENTTTTTVKKEENNQKAIVFDKIIELPADVDFEYVEGVELEEILDTRAFKDEQYDYIVEIPELPPYNLVDTKKDQERINQPNETVDPGINEISEIMESLVSEQELVLFNVFTPNNDGVHDEFMLEAKGLSDFTLIVLDRNNKVVYQTNDPEFRWNGVGLNNEMVPAGKYVYYVTAKDLKGKSVTKYSPLEIIR